MKKPYLLVVGLVMLTTGAWAQMRPYMEDGQFVTVTAPRNHVEGNVRIVPNSRGGHTLMLSGDFKTSEGPALYVVLHKEVIPSSYNPMNTVMLGRLQAMQGQQVYEIPSTVDLSQYKAVIIWCKEFNVTFGSAPLIIRNR